MADEFIEKLKNYYDCEKIFLLYGGQLMEPIRDCKGRIVCMGNAKTGSLEVLYKKQRLSTNIPINVMIRIEREEVITIITRINNKFLIESFELIA